MSGMYTCSCGERYSSEQGRIDCEISHSRKRASKPTDMSDAMLSGLHIDVLRSMHAQLEAHIASRSPDPTPREALADLFKLIEEDWLVRNTEHDHEPDYTIKALMFVRRLARAQKALEPVFSAGGSSNG